jgi:hypothetical protein
MVRSFSTLPRPLAANIPDLPRHRLKSSSAAALAAQASRRP